MVDALGPVLNTMQFGFRPNRGTMGALKIIRRPAESGERTDRVTMLLLLDWAKAFDSVSPAALAKALLRFGLPVHFVTVVETIYKESIILCSK